MSDERRSELHSDDTKGAKQENGRTAAAAAAAAAILVNTRTRIAIGL